MSNDKKWRIISTDRNCEQKLVKKFRKKGIQSFYPCSFYSYTFDGQICSKKRPLFYSTLFLYIADKEMHTIARTRGVMSFMYWLNKPVEVPHKDISRIYNFINSFNNIWVERYTVNPWQSEEIMYSDEEEKTVIAPLNTIGFRLLARQESYYDSEKGLSAFKEVYKLPAFSLNNSLNLAAV